MKTKMNIDDQMLSRMLQVGACAESLAIKVFNFDHYAAAELFIAGYTQAISDLWLLSGLNDDLSNTRLLILSIANMCTSKNGQIITFNQQLQNIAATYGAASKQHRDATNLVAKIRHEISGRKTATNPRGDFNLSAWLSAK